jgi:hypothetical protein
MRPPPIDLLANPDALEITAWQGLRISVDHLYATLTNRGWKLDTEESNLMNGMSKTWREAGFKVWVWLENFVCAPPDGEDEAFASIRFYRFDPATMPSTTMYELTYSPGDEDESWFAGHREEWDWLIEHGDPQFDTFDQLEQIAIRDVPEAILLDALGELEDAIELAD